MTLEKTMQNTETGQQTFRDYLSKLHNGSSREEKVYARAYIESNKKDSNLPSRIRQLNDEFLPLVLVEDHFAKLGFKRDEHQENYYANQGERALFFYGPANDIIQTGSSLDDLKKQIQNLTGYKSRFHLCANRQANFFGEGYQDIAPEIWKKVCEDDDLFVFDYTLVVNKKKFTIGFTSEFPRNEVQNLVDKEIDNLLKDNPEEDDDIELWAY